MYWRYARELFKLNHINYNKLVDVQVDGTNLKFTFCQQVPASFNYNSPYFRDPVITTISIECPDIVKMLEDYPIQVQIVGELRAKNINLDQELRKVKRERDILLNTFGKLTHD